MKAEIGPTDDIAACQAMRYAVFVTEQGVVLSDEQDGQDDIAHHILARLGGQAVGAARIVIKAETGKIGRVCVLPEHRGKGLGAGLIRASLDHLRQVPGVTRAELGAQAYALSFYERQGFVAFGPEYEEINTPHQNMEQAL